MTFSGTKPQKVSNAYCTYLRSPIFEAKATYCITEPPFGPGGHETIRWTADHARFGLVMLMVTVSIEMNND